MGEISFEWNTWKKQILHEKHVMPSFQVTQDSSRKEPVIFKRFSYHNAIMCSDGLPFYLAT